MIIGLLDVRDKDGKFTRNPGSLGKAISYRMRAGYRERLEAIAQEMGKPIAHLTKEVMEAWIEGQEGDRSVD